MNEEQSSYDDIKIQWTSLPKNIINHCNEVARFGGGGSYMILKGCIEEEMAAARSNSGRQFRY
jgi:hypothetical protein